MGMTTSMNTVDLSLQRATGTPSTLGTLMSQPSTPSATPTRSTSTLTRLSLLRLPESSSLNSSRESSGPRTRLRRTLTKSPTTEMRSERTTGRPAPTPPTSKSSKMTSQTSSIASKDSKLSRNSTEPSLSSTATPRRTFSGLWTSASQSLSKELDFHTETSHPTGLSTRMPAQPAPPTHTEKLEVLTTDELAKPIRATTLSELS